MTQIVTLPLADIPTAQLCNLIRAGHSTSAILDELARRRNAWMELAHQIRRDVKPSR